MLCRILQRTFIARIYDSECDSFASRKGDQVTHYSSFILISKFFFLIFAHCLLCVFDFVKQNEFFMFRFGMLSDESNVIMRRKLQSLMDKFIELVHEDTNNDRDNQNRTGLLVSFRPWIPRLFDCSKKAKSD